MKMKKVLAVFLCLMMVVALPVSVAARYDYVKQAYSRLSISGSKATVTGRVTVTSGAEEIDITTRLLRDGKVVNSWSSPTSQTSTSKTISKTVTLTQRGSYQVETEYTVSGSNGEDYGYAYSDEVEY